MSTSSFLLPSTMNSDPFFAPGYMGAQYPSSGMLPPAHKLPSLEGILKRMQHDAAQEQSHSEPQRPLQLSPLPYASMARERRLSPVGKETVTMPSLRTIIHPALTKPSIPQQLPRLLPTCVPHPTTSTPYTSHPTLLGAVSASRKRTWNQCTPAAPLEQPKERAVASSSRPSTSGSARSRASKYCKIEGCERVSQRNNLCHSHGGKRLCKEVGCSSKDRGNGYCIKHGGGKICSVRNCEKKARRKGFCTQHFRVSDGVADPSTL